jgi:outer membrane biosynthesis protein TonB
MAFQAAVASGSTSSAPTAVGLPAPPVPYAAVMKHESGCVIVRVTFGNNGRVAAFDFMRSSGDESVDLAFKNFIYGHWVSQALAGQTLRTPILYDCGDGSAVHPVSLGEINHLPPGSPPRTVVLKVSFGQDGSVKDVNLAQSSGIQQLDADTMAFIWLHWRSLPYAGQTKLVPITFKPGSSS